VTVVTREGILLLDKPAGLTSFGMVERIRRWAKIRKVGHTGTLDPFATGLLVLCLGRATRLAHYITAWDKGYEGTIRLGEETDTDDATGAVLSGDDPGGVTSEALERAVDGFRGEIQQLPPRFSAKKQAGVPSYRRARRGEEVDLKPVPVRIDHLEIISLETPWVRFRARCSKGTYMRSLARDVGRALGCGAHLFQLRRTDVGPLRVEEAISWEDIRYRRGDEVVTLLWPVERILTAWEPVRLDAEWIQKVRHGQDVPGAAMRDHGLADPPQGEHVRLIGERGEFLAVGKVLRGSSGWWIHPEQVWRESEGPQTGNASRSAESGKNARAMMGDD
jgi:tRNA pseudouridine55 synthase